MISEAAATGKPVHILDLDGGSAKFARFHRMMRRPGSFAHSSAAIEMWSYSVPDDTARAGAAFRALVLEPGRTAGAPMSGRSSMRHYWLRRCAVFAAATDRSAGERPGFTSARQGLCWRTGRRSSFVFRSIPWIAGGMVLLVLAAAAWLFLVGRPLWRFDRKGIAVCRLLDRARSRGSSPTPLLKDHWGRARPAQVDRVRRVPHCSPRRHCRRRRCPSNCSFVSGHAALAFSLVAFAFLLPAGPARRRGIGAAFALAGWSAWCGSPRAAIFCRT